MLLAAWRTRAPAARAALALAGVGSAICAGRDASRTRAGLEDVLCLDPLPARELRALYAAADVLVLPSIPTAVFREPWGLVVNEAMNRGLAVIASDAVGAVAGGLVRDGETGVVVPARDSGALAAAIERLAADDSLRARLGTAGLQAVASLQSRGVGAGLLERPGNRRPLPRRAGSVV